MKLTAGMLQYYSSRLCCVVHCMASFFALKLFSHENTLLFLFFVQAKVLSTLPCVWLCVCVFVCVWERERERERGREREREREADELVLVLVRQFTPRILPHRSPSQVSRRVWGHRFRAKREHLEDLPESQGQNLAVTVSYVPYLLESGNCFSATWKHAPRRPSSRLTTTNKTHDLLKLIRHMLCQYK